MIKRTLFILAALLPLCLRAQLGVGSWETFPAYLTPDKLIETPNKVYCLSSGTLMSLDKNSDETYYYGIDNVLSEPSIKDIYYNTKKGYLVVVYNSSNIDVIYDNGDTVNLPEIKDAVMTTLKSINDVAFAGNKMIIATSFGLVVYNDKNMEVEQSGIYNVNVKFVAATDQYIAIYIPSLGTSGKQIGVIELNGKINLLDNFTLTDANEETFFGIYGVSGNKILQIANIDNSRKSKKMTIDPATKEVTFEVLDNKYGSLNNVNRSKNDLYVVSPSQIYVFGIGESKDIEVTKTVNLPADLKGTQVTYWDDITHLFSGNTEGIGEYSFEDGNLTVLSNRYKGNALSSNRVGRITITPTGRVYATQYGHSTRSANDWVGGGGAPSENTANGQLIRGRINRIDNGKIIDVSPGMVKNWSNKDMIMRHNGRVIEDPDDPNIYYTPLYWDGLLKVRVDAEGKATPIVTYNHHNSPLDWQYFTKISDAAIDSKGNLWTIHNGATHIIHVLPADKRGKEIADFDDWIRVYPNPGSNVADGLILPCKNNNMLFFTMWYSHKLYAIDTKGTPDPSDDTSMVWTSFLDQDGKLVDLSSVNITDITEDKNGQVWVSHTAGVFIIHEPTMATNEAMTVIHPKVPRNDGTNFADYLLDGEKILCMGIDNVNRKWFGTETSGAYLVSEDGKSVIANFNTDNSSLPLNTIYAITSDPTSNAVYFGTTAGMVKYNSTAAPAADDYSDVYAYPNPVRPDYNGWITIKGLMDNSQVTITDAAGNEYLKGVSQGGMFIWDGCTRTGQRVKTGVYYVLATQKGSNSSPSTVAKILVVN